MRQLLKGDELIDCGTNKRVLLVTKSEILGGRIRVLRDGEDQERLVEYESLRSGIQGGKLRVNRKDLPKVSAAKQNDPELDKELSSSMWVLREMNTYARTYKVSSRKAYEHVRAKHAAEGLTWPFPSLCTVYRYLEKERKGLPARCGNGNKGNRKPRRPKEVEELVCDIAEDHLLPTESRWSFKAVAEAATGAARERGLIGADAHLSTKYVRRIVAENLSVDVDYDRMDPRTRAAAKSIASRKIRVNGLFTRVEQDALHLPWVVQTEFGPSRDVWLIHAIDCESGMVVGWKLVIGAPRESDGLDCVECILFSKKDKFRALQLDIDIDFYGAPLLLVFDNGPEARGERMKRLTRIGVDTLHLKSRHPQKKPHIERLNRSLKEDLETLPSTTRFDGVDGQRDPEILGDLNMDIHELERWIVRWYFEKWAHNQLKRLRRSMFIDNRDLGHTPAERVRRRVERDGYPLPLPPTPDDWRRTRFEHHTRILSRKTGISFLDYHFKGPNLDRLIVAVGECEVDILVDPDDFRSIFVCLDDELVKLVNEDTDEFTPAYSFQEAKAMDKEKETSGDAHPKVAAFQKDLHARSSEAGAKPSRGKRSVSKETTAKAKEKAAIDRARRKPTTTQTEETEPSAPNHTQTLDDVGELAITDRRTGARV